jgi:valyl-tRNA synthetase
VYLQLREEVDLAGEQERMKKELAELESQIERLVTLLGSPFAAKAPEKIVNAEREKLDGYRASAEKIKSKIN